MAVMAPSLQTPTPRAPRPDRPPSASASYHTSPNTPNTPSHPPRSSKANKYPGLRMVTPPAPDASSHPPSSTSLRHAHHTITPKGSHSSQRKGSMGSIGSERPPTPVSRTSAIDSHSSAAAPGTQSTLLQEKLQRERKSEIQRSLTRLAGEVGAAREPGAALGTPTRCATADGRSHQGTPQTADGKNKGFALKEVDQTMSTLHKQNFDLKLELFHRRQRQTDLEQKIEILEAARTTAEQTNGTLVQELEKRDKAVEEAVHMIVSLEARIELLLREREMTRQVDANNSLLSHLNNSPSTSLGNKGEDSRPQYDITPTDKYTLNRMPSFVSERTENTENLRNVYLDPKPSYLSLARTNPRAGNNGFVSPSMSLLSESSFLSIYGHKVSKETSIPPALPPTIQGRLADGGGQRSVSLPSRDHTPSGSQGVDRPGSWDRARNTGLHPQTNEFSQPPNVTSPLRHAVRQTTPLDLDIERSTTARPNRPQVFPKARKENERPVRRVITHDPGANHHGLPPTPDTMTSSLANRTQMSDDALRGEQGVADMRYPVFTRLTLDQTDEVEPGHWRFKSPEVTQPPSITAFTGRQDTSGASYYENRLPALRRPRSADETTISRHNNDWDSCSDADDLCSEASSFDYWMREGLQPSRGGKIMAQNKSQLGSSRETPDLFNFPSDTKGWQSSMFGSLGGKGYLGVDSLLSSNLDALGASLPTPEAGLFGKGLAEADSSRSQGVTAAAPPTPYRRSSLKAHTSTPGAPAITRASQSQDKPNDFEPGRKRSVSGHLPGTSNSKARPVPDDRSKSPAPPSRSQTQHPDTSAPKRHYPPHASQPQTTTRPRSRAFTSLFRRSLGSTTPQPSASVPPSTAQSPFPPPAPSQAAAPETVGFPAWEHRHDPGAGDASATPPPILRKRGPAVVEDASHGEVAQGDKAGSSSRPTRATASSATKSSLGSGLSDVMTVQAGQEGGGAPLTLPADHAGDPETEAAPPSHGHTRRWFNLGRAMNHKTVGI